MGGEEGAGVGKAGGVIDSTIFMFYFLFLLFCMLLTINFSNLGFHKILDIKIIHAGLTGLTVIRYLRLI